MSTSKTNSVATMLWITGGFFAGFLLSSLLQLTEKVSVFVVTAIPAAIILWRINRKPLEEPTIIGVPRIPARVGDEKEPELLETNVAPREEDQDSDLIAELLANSQQKLPNDEAKSWLDRLLKQQQK